jgi:hypothetical protein
MAPAGVIRALLQAYPDAAKEKDNDRHLPLHYASHASNEIARGAFDDAEDG